MVVPTPTPKRLAAMFRDVRCFVQVRSAAAFFIKHIVSKYQDLVIKHLGAILWSARPPLQRWAMANLGRIEFSKLLVGKLRPSNADVSSKDDIPVTIPGQAQHCLVGFFSFRETNETSLMIGKSFKETGLAQMIGAVAILYGTILLGPHRHVGPDPPQIRRVEGGRNTAVASTTWCFPRLPIGIIGSQYVSQISSLCAGPHRNLNAWNRLLLNGTRFSGEFARMMAMGRNRQGPWRLDLLLMEDSLQHLELPKSTIYIYIYHWINHIVSYIVTMYMYQDF